MRAPAPVRQDRVPALQELAAGFALSWRRPDVRLLVATLSGQALTAGAINVLIVVVALGLLDLGSGGVGLLDAAVGAGSILGALLAIPLVTGRTLSMPLILGALLWGLPLLAIAARPSVAIAVLALGLVGVGNTLVDVAGFTLLQRIVPDDVLARVFGVVESLFYLLIGAGSLLAPLVVSSLGTKAALVMAGLVLPVFVVLAAPRLLRVDRGATVPELEVALLRDVSIFAPLSELALERLARRTVAVAVEAGTAVVVQGEKGDRYYAIDGGEFEVRVDGRPVALLGRGDGFGEIALLRDQPRMATVVAVSEGRLYALDRDAFLTAVTGHSDSEEAANALVVSRLNASLGAGIAR